MFQTVPLSIIRSLALYTQQWYVILKFKKWVKLLLYVYIYIYIYIYIFIIHSLVFSLRGRAGRNQSPVM